MQTTADLEPYGSNILFQVMSVRAMNSTSRLNIFWDAGSNCSLISFTRAEEMGLVGRPVRLKIQKLNEEMENVEPNETMVYNLQLIDKEGRSFIFRVYGIDKTSDNIHSNNYENVGNVKCRICGSVQTRR